MRGYAPRADGYLILYSITSQSSYNDLLSIVQQIYREEQHRANDEVYIPIVYVE